MDIELTHNGAKVPPLTEKKRLGIVKGLDRFSDQLNQREVQLVQYEMTLRAREKKIARLYDDLIKHGNHLRGCPQYGKLVPDACHCGLRSAIAVDRDD